MAKEKRTKPCSNCKKSKVKCLYTNNLPCERCIKSGQAVNCQFVPKLPSLKLPHISPQDTEIPSKNSNSITLPPLNPITGVSASPPSRIQLSYVPQPQSMPVVPTATGSPEATDTGWKHLIENRINAFDNKLSDLVDILKMNQRMLLEQSTPLNNNPHPQPPQNTIQDSSPNYHSQTSADGVRHRQHRQQYLQHDFIDGLYQNTPSGHGKRKHFDSENRGNGQQKRAKFTEENDNDLHQYPTDFRDGFLDIQQARDLFQFFDTHISPQLFGFEISRFSVDSIWETSPILICAICTIASMHHPDSALCTKLQQLQMYLHRLCGDLLYQGRPRNEFDGFNTIVALVLCSFWLSDSQMFTGLALQLAKEIGLNSPASKEFSNNKSGLNEKDRLKLWYLLYVLDGQQSLTFNRQPLVSSQEYSLNNSRDILLNEKRPLYLTSDNHQIENGNGNGGPLVERKKEEEASAEDLRIQKEIQKQRFTDMRLVSQVEYNQALSEAFKGNAWELLAPSELGIPSKSNLELDKWMVSWTVLLSPVNNGSIWSSKSTLIYYNFAKMHINSSAVRQLQVDTGNGRGMFPKWNHSSRSQQPPKKIELTRCDLDSDDETDDEEFVSNRDHISDDETTVSASIAINAAQTVLNLVLNDDDILNNLKYVPVHVHIMLYYAALLLINPPLDSGDKSVEFKPEQAFTRIIANLKIVKNLHRKIYTNLPTDKQFGNKLIKSLDEIVVEKLVKVRNELNSTDDIDKNVKIELNKQLATIGETNASNIVEIKDSSYDSTSSRSTTPRPEKISAWPGSNHGHP